MTEETKNTIRKEVETMSLDELKLLESAMSSLYWATTNHIVMAVCEEIENIIDNEVRNRIRQAIDNIALSTH